MIRLIIPNSKTLSIPLPLAAKNGRYGDLERRRHGKGGDMEKRRPGEWEIRRGGERETRRQEDKLGVTWP